MVVKRPQSCGISLKR